MLNDIQYKEHYSSIGGSRAASILGVDANKSNVEAYLELVDEKYRAEQSEKMDDVLAIKIGNLLEDVIAETAARDNGWVLKKARKPLTHNRYDFLRGHLDRRIVNKKSGLEIKVRGRRAAYEYGEEGTDEVKDTDYIQCMHYLMCDPTLERMHMAILFLEDYTVKYFVVERDDNVILAMEEKLVEFWLEHVAIKNPPEPITYEDACKVWRKSEAAKIVATDEIYNQVKFINKANYLVKKIYQKIDVAKTNIANYMQSFDTLEYKGKDMLTFKTQEAERIDAKAVRELCPEKLDQLIKITDSRVMRFKKIGD